MRNVTCTGGVCAFDPTKISAPPDGAMSADEFRREVLEAPVPVVVEFYRKEGCSRCKRVAPAVAALSKAHGGRTKLVTIDVDKNPALAQQFYVGPLPHFALFSGGSKIAEERPNLIPGEQRKRHFADDQVDLIFSRALNRA